jgi:hypothetical protein
VCEDAEPHSPLHTDVQGLLFEWRAALGPRLYPHPHSHPHADAHTPPL